MSDRYVGDSFKKLLFLADKELKGKNVHHKIKIPKFKNI